MFTGIVSGLGTVKSIERRRGGVRLRVRPPAGYGGFSAGESVCVSGVCLTAVETAAELAADLSPETLRRSSLRHLRPGDAVNLERALRWGDRLSGHFVMGHVDGISRVLRIARTGNCRTLRFSIPRGLSRYVVPKGSVALDGISLTVAAKRRGTFEIALIPDTLRRTTLGSARTGDSVNFEVDVFARYGRAGTARRARAPRKAR